MAYVIALAGKGGVGKTTVAAFLIKYLSNIDGPVLAVDADPNSNLDVSLGMKYEHTVSEIREESRKTPPASMSKSDYFNMRLQEIISEGKNVDLLVMGNPEGPGCYCAINNILRDYVSGLNKNYKFVVIDNEAGMEHLSRRTAGDIDRLLLVSDDTMVALRAAVRSFNIAESSGVRPKRTSLVINKSGTSLSEESMAFVKGSGLDIEGYIKHEESLRKNSESGRPVPDINIEGLEEIFSKIIRA